MKVFVLLIIFLLYLNIRNIRFDVVMILEFRLRSFFFLWKKVDKRDMWKIYDIVFLTRIFNRFFHSIPFLKLVPYIT